MSEEMTIVGSAEVTGFWKDKPGWRVRLRGNKDWEFDVLGNVPNAFQRAIWKLLLGVEWVYRKGYEDE